MINRKKQKQNPLFLQTITFKDFEMMKEQDIENNISFFIEMLEDWIRGDFMRKSEISERILNNWLIIKKGLYPYLSRDNKKIYRSVVLDKPEYGDYCYLDIRDTYMQTGNKPLQNWTFSKNFAYRWGPGEEGMKKYNFIQIIFESNTIKNYDKLVYTPESFLKWCSKLYVKYPNFYFKFKKKLDGLLSYINSRAEELLLYDVNGEVFVNNMHVLGC